MSFFDALGPGGRQENASDFEIVEGRFTCQENGCWEPAHEAKYFEDALLLTWKCPKGHICKITEFVI